MIISRKRLEEIVAGRLQEQMQNQEVHNHIDCVDNGLRRRMDMLERRVDDMAEKLREIEARFRIPNNGVVYSVKDIPCDVTRAELVERPVEGMPCRKG